MITYLLANWFLVLLPFIRDEKDPNVLNNVCFFTLQRSWTIVTILGGKQLRGHMLSCSAGWKKEELHGKKPIK